MGVVQEKVQALAESRAGIENVHIRIGCDHALELAIESMASYSLEKQGMVLLSYGRLMEDRGQAATAANSYEKAGQMGSLEGWYRYAYILKDSRPDRPKALKACFR